MKILSNKKYNELILKSCKGMFGAVTDDMLLRDNALLNEEVKQLKEVIDKARECIKNFLCTEEYINVNGIAIADNYSEVLEILKEVEK